MKCLFVFLCQNRRRPSIRNVVALIDVGAPCTLLVALYFREGSALSLLAAGVTGTGGTLFDRYAKMFASVGVQFIDSSIKVAMLFASQASVMVH